MPSTSKSLQPDSTSKRVMLIRVQFEIEPDLAKDSQAIYFYVREADHATVVDWFTLSTPVATALPPESLTLEKVFESEKDAHKYYQENWGGESYHSWPILIVDNEPSSDHPPQA